MGRDVWRLLDSGPGRAARNMAVDEAILREYVSGRTPPTLRFYRWDPPALSIGRFQELAGEVNLSALAAQGIGWVRRPTGGRAVLHHGDLTYSVVVGEALLSGSVVETYRKLSAGLLAGLALLGVSARLAGEAPAGTGPKDPACFAEPSSYELLVQGRKLVGSAQVRRRGTILQHGSVLLDFDPFLLARLTAPPGEVERRAAAYRERVVGLGEVLGRVPPYRELVEALARGFAGALGVSLAPGPLTDREESLARELAPAYAQG